MYLFCIIVAAIVFATLLSPLAYIALMFIVGAYSSWKEDREARRLENVSRAARSPAAQPPPQPAAAPSPAALPPPAPIAPEKPRIPMWFRSLRLVRTLVFVAGAGALGFAAVLGLASLLDPDATFPPPPEEQAEACALAGIIAEIPLSTAAFRQHWPGDRIDWNEELASADAALDAKRLRFERFARALAACEAAHGSRYGDRAIALATARLVELGYTRENPPSEEEEILAIRDAFHALAEVSSPEQRTAAVRTAAAACGVLAVLIFLLNWPLHRWLRKRRLSYR